MRDAIAELGSSKSEEGLLSHFEEVLRHESGGFAEREATALRVANELVRRWIERELERMEARYGDEVQVGEDRYRRHASGVRRYHTLCGPAEVRRYSYRLVGLHNGPTVVPLEIEAKIVENATPALAFSVTQGFAERPLRHYEEEMVAAHREVPSRSTLERIGKRVGERIQHALPVIEPVVRTQEALPANAHSISVGLDRTTVPMAEPAEQPRRRRRDPYVRRPPAPVTVAYRMSYIATVAIHDDSGEALICRRFAASAAEGSAELMAQVASEVKWWLGQCPALALTIVQDGAPELWNLVDAWLKRDGLAATAKVIDRFHVNERLAQICLAIAADHVTARELYMQWQTQLDRSDTAIDRICRQLNELANGLVLHEPEEDPMIPAYWTSRIRRGLAGQAVREAWGHLAYLDGHRKYLRYASSRKRGLPIGSGVTEGACKSVVTMRFKRSGQR